MKSLLIFIALIAHCAAADAFDNIELVYSRGRNTLAWHSKVTALNTAPSLLSIGFEDDNDYSIKLLPFDFTSKVKSERKLNLSNIFLLGRLSAFAGKSNILLAVIDGNGAWSLINYSIGLNKTIKNIALNEASLVSGVLSCGNLYFVYGVTNKNYPFILNANIASGSVGSNMLSSTVQGEVSDMACGVNGEIIAVANYRNAKSDLVIIGDGDKVAKTIPIHGGATSFAVTPTNKIILSYHRGRDLYVELLDDKRKSLWINHILKIKGIATQLMQVIVLNNGEFSIIGANDEKMFAMHLDGNGKEVSLLYDSHGFSPPVDGNYYVFADERGIHVRGFVRDKKILKMGNYSEVYFLVK